MTVHTSTGGPWWLPATCSWLPDVPRVLPTLGGQSYRSPPARPTVSSASSLGTPSRILVCIPACLPMAPKWKPPVCFSSKYSPSFFLHSRRYSSVEKDSGQQHLVTNPVSSPEPSAASLLPSHPSGSALSQDPQARSSRSTLSLGDLWWLRHHRQHFLLPLGPLRPLPSTPDPAAERPLITWPLQHHVTNPGTSEPSGHSPSSPVSTRAADQTLSRGSLPLCSLLTGMGH